MSAASDLFRAQVEDPLIDPVTAGLRRAVADAKREAVDQATGLEAGALGLVMPGLYQNIIAATIDLAAHIGLPVALALDAFDERLGGHCVAGLGPQVRMAMAAAAEALRDRHSSRVAEQVAEVEACRSHWRDIEPSDADATQALRDVQQRVAALVGEPLALLLTAHDHYMLEPSIDDGAEQREPFANLLAQMLGSIRD